ncbi:MAG: DUF1611 domain-containing protein [Blastocatellia bacterium]|nr:DUF1611 domain-containing protein [Blastocatellia bacterium]
MDGTALVFCEGAFGTPRGKTANTLVRLGERYEVVGVIDSQHCGLRAGAVVEGVASDVPVFESVRQAIDRLGNQPDYFVVGLDPDDGRLEPRFRKSIAEALRLGMHVDSALRPYLHDDAEFPGIAMLSGARMRSVGRPMAGGSNTQYTGQVEELRVFRVAVVGTNAVGGKIITAVRLMQSFRRAGVRAELIGTSQLAWFQGIAHTTILDSVPQGYVAGELEATMLAACATASPDVLVLEGRGGLLDPAHPCDLELLTTARPDAVVLQHAPAHESISAEDTFGLAVLSRHMRVLEAVTQRPVVAVSLSHAGKDAQTCRDAATLFRGTLGCLVTDIVSDGPEPLAATLLGLLVSGTFSGAQCAQAGGREPIA